MSEAVCQDIHTNPDFNGPTRMQLTLDQTLECAKEFREGHRGAFRIANHRVALRSERRNGERHGPALIAVRLTPSARQAARGTASHAQAVRKLLNGCPH